MAGLFNNVFMRVGAPEKAKDFKLQECVRDFELARLHNVSLNISGNEVPNNDISAREGSTELKPVPKA